MVSEGIKVKSKFDVVFRINYLLGVSADILKQDFPDLYEQSGSLGLFENYCDAKTLRCLSSVRQCLIRNYILYKNANSYNVMDFNEDNISYLLLKNIDIKEIFKSYKIDDVFNILTHMINIILYKVFVDLEIPYTEDLENYFYFPDKVGVSDLAKYYNEYKEFTYPYNIFIYEGKNIKQSLKYALHSDRNCIYSIYSILNLRFSGDVDSVTLKFRTTEGVELDETAVIVSEKVIAQYFDKKKVKEDKNIEKISKPKVKCEEKIKTSTNTSLAKLEIKFDVPNKIITSELKESSQNIVNVDYLNSDLYKFLKGGANLFIDCREVNIFKFISVYERLSNEYDIHKLVLVLDEYSNPLWNVFDRICSNVKNIKFVSVSSIKGENNTNDIILTKEICESIYLEQVKKVFVFSSNFSYFSLISMFKDIDFSIGYTENNIDMQYLGYLNKRSLPVLNLNLVNSVIFTTERLETILGYSLLLTLYKVPLMEWSEESIYEKILNSILKDLSMEYNKELKQYINLNYNKVKIDIKDKKVKVLLDELTYEN